MRKEQNYRERLYSFKELTEIGSQLYNLGEEGKKAATALVERTDRLLRQLPEKDRDQWAREAAAFSKEMQPRTK